MVAIVRKLWINGSLLANVGCYGYPLKQYTFESTLFFYEPLFKHNFWWNAINWVRKSSSKIQFQNNLYQLLELWLYILKFSQYLWYLLIMIPLQCLKISSPFLKSIFAVLQKYLCHLSLWMWRRNEWKDASVNIWSYWHLIIS